MPSTNGFILGLIGGLLDFASASLLLVGQSGGAGMINQSSVPVYAWAAILLVVGSAVILTSIISVMSIGIDSSRIFPLLMIAYGVIMIIIGAAMSSGYIMASDVSIIYSYGMLIVGAAMVVNGVMMSRSPMPL